MSIVVCGASALSVALLYYGYRSFQQRIDNRSKQLRERVTYMLWVMANSVPA